MVLKRRSEALRDGDRIRAVVRASAVIQDGRTNGRPVFHPDRSFWANPIEAHFGPRGTFVIAGSNYPNHVVATRAQHDHMRWGNANTRHHPGISAAQRRERARGRSEKGIRRGGQPSPEPLDQPGEPTGHSTSQG